MKIGDKVYCYKGTRGYKNKLIHKKGNLYKILDIETKIDVPWSNSCFDKYYCLLIECENVSNDFENKVEYYQVDVINDYTFIPGYCYVFSQHFLSEKEYRNIKLKNIKASI